MSNFILRRLLLLIPIFIGVSILSFLMMHLIPGDPARIMAGQDATYEEIQSIRVEFGLDKPLPVQYVLFMEGVLDGNLKSIKTQRPVLKEIYPRFLNTLELSLVSILISAFLGLGFGIIAAVKHNSWLDNFVMGFSLFGVSMPVFWLGILLIIVFSLMLGWLPAAGKGGIQHIILPSITLGMATSAIIARMTRASMLQVMNQDFIRTADAFGVSQRKIIYKYTLKNALIPVVTVIGLQFGYMLGGAVLTESVFGWPGLGRFIVDSIFARDYPVVQVGIMLIALTFVLVNLLVDITYAFLDPRIRRR
ncbi:ABC transporter permease [Mesoaciditoga lauensis]|uniref:ABC transporter permease n=1 Tax=Mesoaciditoga lauensis TaxID=1495039 RepID=UPI0005616E60|nr:ABC transporter permease [Mesoaciditoga lauensis]